MSKYKYPIGPEFSNIYMDKEIKTLARASIPVVIGITGPTKSGKTNFARTLSSEYGFHYISLSKIITEYFNALYINKEPNWKALGEVARKIRKSESTFFFAEQALNEIRKTNYSNTFYIIDGVLHPDEIDYFSREVKHFIMIGLNPRMSVRKKYLIADGTMTKAELIERDLYEQLNKEHKTDSLYYPNISKCLRKISDDFMYSPKYATRKLLIETIKDFVSKLNTKNLL